MKLVGECRLAVSGQRLAPPTLTYAYSAMVLVDADNLLYPPEHYKINGKWQESAAGEVGRQRSDVTTGARSEVTKRNVATRRRGEACDYETSRGERREVSNVYSTQAFIPKLSSTTASRTRQKHNNGEQGAQESITLERERMTT
jgi:hypothetical protein